MGEHRFGQLGRPKSAPLRFLPAARVDENGAVWTWGHGVSNNLGVRLNGARERHTPEQVPGLAAVARIVAAGASVMAVMRDGSVRAWGEPPLFTAGERVFPGVATPIVVAGLVNVTDIVGGPDGGYALTRESRVFARDRYRRR